MTSKRALCGLAAFSIAMWWAASVRAGQPAGAEQPRMDTVRVLSAAEVLTLALANNPDIRMLRYDAKRARTLVREQQGSFDTVLDLSAGYRDDQSKQQSAVFPPQTTSQYITGSLGRRLPTGTDISLSLGSTRTSAESPFVSLNPAHEASVGIFVRQPVGRNALGMHDRGNVSLAALNAENAEELASAAVEQLVAAALKAYWYFVLAEEAVAIDRDMASKAVKLSRITRDNKTRGLAEEADLLATQANLKLRQAALRAQKHERERARITLLRFIFESDPERKISPGDTLQKRTPEISREQSLLRAMANRRDYARAKNNVDARRINLAMKKNARWPEIDLEASLTRNSLESTRGVAWEQVAREDNPMWYVGVRLSLPLENRRARAQAEQAGYDKEKALVELKKIEQNIVMDVASAVDALDNARSIVKLRTQVVRFQEEKFAAEERRFRQGRSSSDLLIRYQEDVLEAKRALAAAHYACHVATIEVYLAEQTLLGRQTYPDVSVFADVSPKGDG